MKREDEQIYQELAIIGITPHMHDTYFGSTVGAFLQAGYKLHFEAMRTEYCYNVDAQGRREFMPLGPAQKKLIWRKNDDVRQYLMG